MTSDFTVREVLTLLRNAIIDREYTKALGWLEELEDKLKEQGRYKNA